MKVFQTIVTKPFIYFCGAEKKANDIAWVKFREAIIVAENQEEVNKKIRSTLPPEDKEVKDILRRSGIKGEYYSIQTKELEGKDGVYFC